MSGLPRTRISLLYMFLLLPAFSYHEMVNGVLGFGVAPGTLWFGIITSALY